MSPLLIQILTIVTSLVAGGGILRLVTIRAERNKILGEGAVERAIADKTYHEMNMEMLREARVELGYLRGEVDELRVRVKNLSTDLDVKDRRIRDLEAQLNARS